jgi:MFS family permease
MICVLAVTQAVIYPLPPYNFSPAAVGLMSLPPAIGALLGSLIAGPFIDWFSLFIAKKRKGIHEPEVRLWFYLVPGLGLVLGTLLYGLTIAKV